MPELIIRQAGNPPENFPLVRSNIKIGRSARNEICIPDPFASRVHAEIRKEGDSFWLQDLGSANGTRFNSQPMDQKSVQLSTGDEIRIGETVIVFQDIRHLANKSAPVLTSESALNPAMTISLHAPNSSTAELIESIQARKSTEFQFQNSRGDLLALISKVGVTLLASNSLDETLQQIAALVFEAVPADRCVIMLRDDKAEDKSLNIAVARLRDSQEDVGEIRVSRTVVREVTENGKSILTSDAQHDLATQTMTLVGIRSVLAVPLRGKDDVFGLIYADSPMASLTQATFNEEHLKVLTTLASVAAIRVENTQLLEERFERERMERELQLASEIQQRLQPSTPPKIAGYEFQGISFPCYEIGGDYFDYIPREDGKIIVALGDVSGKGTAGALVMSSLHAAIHSQIAAGNSLLELVKDVNQYLSDNTPSNRFVTLFISEIDPQTGKFGFISAGHNPALLVRADGIVEQLDSVGLPLGLLPFADYSLGENELNEGDVLVIYSDGVSESTNPQGEEYGVERLKELVVENNKNTALQIRDKIDAALTKFADTEPAGDDITLVIVKRQ